MNFKPKNTIESVYEALTLGLRDYVSKCGFSKVIIGLSGGIDSALVSVLAKDAIGKENVLVVTMPGPYSEEGPTIEKLHELIKFMIVILNQ